MSYGTQSRELTAPVLPSSVGLTMKAFSSPPSRHAAAATSWEGRATSWRGADCEKRQAKWIARKLRTSASAASGASRAASVRSLEQVTLNDSVPPGALPYHLEGGPTCPGQFGVKVTSYAGEARVVLFRSKGAPRSAGAGSASDAVKWSGASDPSKLSGETERCASSIARSRRLVVHRARELVPVAMWTFTKRGKFASAAEAWIAWAKFSRLMKLRYKAAWRYVAVPELHSDGETWHLHVLVDRIYMVETLRVLWSRALGGTGGERGDQSLGNVDVKGSRNRRASARRFATYVAKYVGKGFERGGANRRVFAASVGLGGSHTSRWHCPYDIGLAEFVDASAVWLREAFGVERFYPVLITRDGIECALADVPLAAAA